MSAEPQGPRLVADLMTASPITILDDAPLAEVVKTLESHHISGLPVVDAAGALVGVISQTDMLRARTTEYLWANWANLHVRHLMSSPALTIEQGQPLSDAARKMERHNVGRLVVVADEDELRPVGVISASDVVRAMSAFPQDGVGAAG